MLSILQGISLESLTFYPDGENTLQSKCGEHCASDFTSSIGTPFKGFGFTNHCPFFDPTEVEEDPRPVKLWSHFLRTEETIAELLNGENVQTVARKLGTTITINNDLSKVSKTKANYAAAAIGKDRTVQQHHLDVIKQLIFPSSMETSTGGKCSKATLADLSCSTGIAGKDSVPDGCLVDINEEPRGIYAVKHGTDAPAECLRKGSAEASNIAFHQLKRGVTIDDIVVPVIGSNGYLIQFGVVTMLRPSFPMFSIISNVLDLSDDTFLLEAARLFCCIKIMINNSLQFNNHAGSLTPATLSLSMQAFHCKPLSMFFSPSGNIQSSLFHFFKLMSKLHQSHICRPYVVFPFCIREYDDSVTDTVIVFPKLDQEYKFGLPTLKTQRLSFLKELKDAILSFHTLGIVHFDLYPSNIAWRAISETEVKLKVIDWDAAHFCHETLSSDMEERLEGRRDEVMEKAAIMDGATLLLVDSAERMKYYDLSLFRVLEMFIDEPSLCATEKKLLDSAFLEVQLKFLTL